MNNEFLNVKEVAEIFGISTQAIYKWIKAKKIEVYKISKKGIRIRPDNLLRFLKESNISGGEIQYFKKSIENFLMQKYRNPYKSVGI